MRDSLGRPLDVAAVEKEMGSGNRIRRMVILVPLLSVSGFIAGFAIGSVLDPAKECHECYFNISDGQGWGMTIGFFGGALWAVYDAFTIGRQKDFDDVLDRLRNRR